MIEAAIEGSPKMLSLLVWLALVVAASAPVSLTSRTKNKVPTPRTTCGRCKRPAGASCICAVLPPTPIALSTRVLILQHPREAKKAIASVPLISLCLKDVTVMRANVPWLRGSEPLPRPEFFQRSLHDGYKPLLLYPAPDALVMEENLSEAPPSSKWADRQPKTLLVLIDGTWSQAQNLMRHSPGLAAACQRAMFAGDQDAIISHLRREPQQHCTSTLEACARALRIVEPTAEAAAAACSMERALQAMVDGQLRHRELARIG